MPIRQRVAARLRPQGLEPRIVLDASFAVVAGALTLADSTTSDNQDISISADANNFYFTLSSGVWDGTDSVGQVTGDNTSVLTVDKAFFAGLASGLSLNSGVDSDNDVSFTGATTVDFGNNIAITAGGTITGAGTDVTVTGTASLAGSSVTLATGTESLNVTGAATFTSTTGGITVGGGGIVSFGTLTFNSAGAVSVQENSDIALAGDNTADTLTLISAGAITDGSTSLAVTGNASFVGTSIAIGGAGTTTNFGSLTFGSGSVTIQEDSATALAGSNSASSLTLTSAGAITDGSTSLAVTGNAAFNGTAITVGGAGITTNFGSLTFNSAGAVTVQEDSATALAGANAAGSLTLTSAAAITDGSTSLNVTNNAAFSGTTITVGGGGTATNLGSLTFNSAGAVTIQEDSATALAGDNTALSLALTSAGAITDSSTSLAVTNNAAFNGTAITVGGGATTTSFGSLTFNSAGSVSIQEDSATALAGALTAGSLALTSTGAITDGSTSLAVTNNAAFSGTTITIGGGGTTTNLGSLTFNSTGAVTIQEDSATDLAGDNTADSLALTSAGAITDSSTSLAVANNAAFSGTAITVGGAGTTTTLGSLRFNSAGAVSIQEDSDTALAGGNTADSLVLSSTGAITDGSTSLAVTNLAFVAGTSITLGGVGITTNFGSLTFSTSGAVSLQEDSDSALAGLAGSLTVSSAGAITQTAAISVTGTSSFTAATTITLTTPTNEFVGAVSLNNTGANSVSIADTTALTLGASTLGSGTFTVTAGAILQTGAITQAVGAGTATFNGNAGGIALTNPSNNFTGAVVLNTTGAASAAVTDVNAINLGTSTLGTGTLTVTAVGITQSGTITQAAGAGAATFNGGAAAINLSNPGNDFTGSVSLNNSGAFGVSITDVNAIILGASSLGSGALTVTAAGITQTGGIVQAPAAGAVTLNSAGNAINLSDAGNDFTGVVAATGTTVNLRDDANGMVLGNIAASAGLTVGSDDAITQAGATTISGGGLTKLGPGTLTLSRPNTYTGTTTVSDGVLLVTNTSNSGTGTSSVLVNTGGTLGGNGRITGSVTVASGGTLAPGLAPGTTATLEIGSLTFLTGSFFVVDINTQTAGSGYDQLDVTGTVTIQAGVTLTTSGTIGSTPGQEINLIINDGNDSISGTFAGLPDEGTRTVNGIPFIADYQAGNGSNPNNFRLTQSGAVLFISDGVGAGNLELRRVGNNIQFLDDGVIINSVSYASVQNDTITVIGANGQSETLTINYVDDAVTDGFFDVDVEWNGGELAGDNDRLDINGGVFTTVTHTFTTTGPANSGTIAYNTGAAVATINYTGLEPVDMAGSTITDLIFNLADDANDTIFLEDAGGGLSRIRSAGGLFETTTFDNGVTSVTVNMGGDSDDLEINLPSYTGSLIVNGGAGTDDVLFTGVTDDLTSLTVTVSGTITDAAAATLDVTNNASFSGSSITLGDDATVTFGSLTFNSAGAVLINEGDAVVLAGTSTAASLTLTAATGTITDASGADLSVTSLATFTATGAGGGITLGNEANNNDAFGSLTFNSVGAVSISEDDAVVVTGTNTASSLALTAESGSLTDATDADITVTGLAALAASGAGGAITIGDEANNADAFGSLTFNSVGAVSINEDDAIVVAGTNTAASLALTAETDSITDATDADIAVTGLASFTASNGAIVLGDEANNADTFGSLTFNAQLNVSISEDNAMVLVGSNTALSLALTAETGSITDAADADISVVVQTTFTANGAGGAITIGDEANNADVLGSLTFNSVGAVSISQDDTIGLFGTNTAASLALTAENGSIFDASDADIAVTGLASFTADTGSIILGDEANNADTFGSLTFNSQVSVDISEDDAMVVAGTNTAFVLTLTAETGSITDATDADITVTGPATFTANGAGGAITIGDEANNLDSFSSLTFNSVGAVSISEDDAVLVVGTNTAASLALTAEAGSISDASDADITVTGLAALAASGAGGAITIGGLANNADAFGSLTFNSVGAVSISEDDAVVVAGTNTAASLLLIAETGSITDAAGADIAVTAGAAFVGPGGITLGDEASNNDTFGTVNFLSNGAVSISEDDAMVVSGTNTADSLALTAEAGSITDNAGADIVVTGLATFTATGAGGAITIGDEGDNFDSFGSLTFNSGGAVSISEEDGLLIAGASSAGQLTLVSETGAITQAAVAVVVTGTTSLQAAGDILLDSATNNFDSDGTGDAVSVVSAVNATLRDVDSIVLGSVAATATVRVRAGADVTQDASGITAAALGVEAGGNVLLCTAGNDVDTVAIVAGGTATFRDSDTVALGTVTNNPVGIFTADLNGITATTVELFVGGDFDFAGGVTATNLSLDVNGDVTQSVAIVLTGTLAVRATGSINLVNAANSVAGFAAQSGAGAGNFLYYRDANALNVVSVAAGAGCFGALAGVTAGGDIEILTGGPLDLQAVVTADGDDVRLQATAGSITQTVAGIVTAASLSAQANNGSVELCIAPNDVDVFAGFAGTAVRFMDADNFALGTVLGGVLVTSTITGVTAPSEIDLRAGSGDLAITQALTSGTVRLQADNGAVTQSGSGTIAATSLVARASGNVDLQLGNDVNTFAAETTTSTGSIYFRDVDDLVIGTVAGSICVTGATGVVAGDLSEETGAAGDIEIRTGGFLFLQAVVTAELDDIRLQSTGSAIIQNAAGVVTGGRLSAQAFNDVNLCLAVNNVDEFSATSTVGSVYFRDFDGVSVNTLAGGVLVTSAVTGITAGVDVEIMAVEGISVDQAITAIGDDVRLQVTGGSISQSAAGVITTARLSAQASNDIDLGAAANDVNVFAATATTGDVFFRDANDLIVDSVLGGVCVTGTVNGITAGTDIEILTGGNLTLQLAVTATGDDVRLQSTAGSITQTATGVLTAANLSAQAATDVNLCVSAANDVDVFAGVATTGSVMFRDADDLIVGSVTGGTLVTAAVNGIAAGTDAEVLSAGALSLQQAITAVGDDVRLQSATGSVTQSGAGTIAAGSLSVQAQANVDLQLGNDVDTFAAITGNGFVYFRDLDDLVVGAVAGGVCVTTAVSGITANGVTDVEVLTGGDLSLQQAVTALFDDVRLQSTAGSITQTAAGVITATNLSAQANAAGQSVELCLANNDVDLFAASAGSAVRFMDVNNVTFGNVAGGVLVTGAVNGVTAPDEIDLRSVGTLTANVALSSGTIRLQSDIGSVLQSAGITAGSLLVRAAGQVNLSSAVNDVDIISASAGTGNVFFQDVDDVTVGAVAGSICIAGSAGITAGLDVEVRAAGNLGVDQAITALGDDVRLQSTGGSIVQSATGVITSSTLSAFAAGTVDLGVASSDVDFFAATGTAGNVYFRDLDDLRITALPGGTIVTTAGSGVTAGLDIELLTGGNLSLEAALTSSSNIRLLSTAGSITQTAAGVVTTANLSAAAGTLVSLAGANNDVDVFAATTATGDVAFFDVDSVAIGTVAAGARVLNAVDGIIAAGGTANVVLTANGAVTDGNGAGINVTANVFTVASVNGLGTSAEFFETSVASLFANIVGTGGVYLFETDAIILESVTTADGSIAVVTNDADRLTVDLIAGTNTPAANLGAGAAANATITVRSVTAGDATPLDANASTALLVAKGSGGDIVFQGTTGDPLGVGGTLMVFNTAAASAALVAGGDFVFTSGQSTIMTVDPVTALAYAIARNFDRAGYYSIAGGQVPIGNNGDVSITLDTVGVAGELGLNVYVDWGDLDNENFFGFPDTSPRYTGASFGGAGWTADPNATYLTGGNSTTLFHNYSQADQFARGVAGTLPGSAPNLFYVDFAVAHDPSIVVLASSVNGQALTPIDSSTGETLGLASSTDVPTGFANLDQYSPGSVDAATVRPGTALDTVDSLDDGRVEILLSSVVTFITLPVQTETEVIIERVFPQQVSEFVSVSLPTTPVEPIRQTPQRSASRELKFELVIIPDDPNAEPEVVTLPKDILDGNNLELLLKNLPDGSYELRYRMGETGNPRSVFRFDVIDKAVRSPDVDLENLPTELQLKEIRSTIEKSVDEEIEEEQSDEAGAAEDASSGASIRNGNETDQAGGAAQAAAFGDSAPSPFAADPDRASPATEIERTLSDGPAAASDAAPRAALAGVPLLLAAWRGVRSGAENPFSRSARRRRRANS